LHVIAGFVYIAIKLSPKIRTRHNIFFTKLNKYFILKYIHLKLLNHEN